MLLEKEGLIPLDVSAGLDYRLDLGQLLRGYLRLILIVLDHVQDSYRLLLVPLASHLVVKTLVSLHILCYRWGPDLSLSSSCLLRY